MSEMRPTLRNLPSLATEINAEHEAAERAINDSLQHARRCGELLIEAKAQCKHGEWRAWVDANFASSYRTAAGYMQIARANVQALAHLGIEGALKALAEPREAHLLDESADDTAHLLSTPANAEALFESIAELDRGEGVPFTMEPEGGKSTAAPTIRGDGGYRDDELLDHPGSPALTAKVDARHFVRPVDHRVRELIGAAQAMRVVSDDDLSALQTNDLMVEGLRAAVTQIQRVINLHSSKDARHANG